MAVPEDRLAVAVNNLPQHLLVRFGEVIARLRRSIFHRITLRCVAFETGFTAITRLERLL
jgi:hypothetical protein